MIFHCGWYLKKRKRYYSNYTVNMRDADTPSINSAKAIFSTAEVSYIPLIPVLFSIKAGCRGFIFHGSISMVLFDFLGICNRKSP